MAILSIPKRQYAALRKLSALSEAQFEELVNGLNSIKASLSPFDFCQSLSEKTKSIPLDDIKHLVGMLCGLYPAKENNKKTASEISHDLRETLEEEKPANFPPDKFEALEDRMLKLLSIDKAIAVTAKAQDIVTDHAHVFCGAKVLSDIRPVFSASADNVSAAIVVHTLKIGYHEAREHKEFYVAMDKNDLELLCSVLERASKKASQLHEIIEKSGISYLEEGEN
jgi:hypothetical protein